MPPGTTFSLMIAVGLGVHCARAPRESVRGGAPLAPQGAACAHRVAEEVATRWEHFDEFRRWTRLNARPFISHGHGEGERSDDIFVDVYVNDLALPAARARQGPFPVGSMAVKPHYAIEANEEPAAEAMAYTVMVKCVPLIGPEAWEWIDLDAQGRVNRRGRVRPECSGCHERADTGDFVFADTYGH